MRGTGVMILSLNLVSVILLCGPVSQASEKNVDSTLSSKISKIKPGDRIRVSFDSRGAIQGRLANFSNDSLRFSDDSLIYSVPLTSVDRLWERGSATFKGTKIGAVTGSIAGLGFGTLLYVGTQGTDINATSAVFIVSPIVGAFVGGLFGTAIGSATSKWHLKYDRSKMSRPKSKRISGSVRLLLGYSKHTTYFGDYGFGGHVAYCIQITTNLAFGPELSYHKPRYYYAGGIVTYSLNMQPAPYIIVGGGTGVANYVDGKGIYSIGGGVNYRATPLISLIAEIRWHDIAAPRQSNFTNFRAGVAVNWR